MKILTALILAAGLATPSFAQGTMYFANFEPGALSKEIFIPQGVSAASFTAQLYAAPQGSSLDALVPLIPVTRFRPGFEGIGRLQLILVDVPFAQPGDIAQFQIRV